MLTSMPVAVYRAPRDVAVEQRPIPEPGPGEVLVEVARCGVCGSDLHLVLEGYARPGSVLGHEWSGRIAALGPGADGWLIGERVVGRPEAGCGECESCRRGRPSVCRNRPPADLLSFTGAYARYTVLPAERLTRIPDGLDDRAAALTEPLAVALHALSLADVPARARTLVTGAGPVGLMVIALLARRGVESILVSEPSPTRRDQAWKAGATRVVSPEELPDAPMGRTVEEAVDVAFDCSGRADAAAAALSQLDRAGRLVLLGTGSELPRLNHNRMITQELSVVGAYNYDACGFDAALALLSAGDLPVDALVDPNDVPLAGLLDAMLACERGERPAKVLVDPSLDGGPHG